jgi:hypothetical protein
MEVVVMKIKVKDKVTLVVLRLNQCFFKVLEIQITVDLQKQDQVVHLGSTEFPSEG